MASSAEVRVVAATRVPLLRRPQPHLEQIPLSLFDAPFVAFPAINRVFFYDDDGGADYPSLVESLKSSLADTIAVYFPLAGKLTYLPSTGDVVVDCSPSAVADGVAFLEVEVDGGTPARTPTERLDVPAFLRLVPSLEVPELPAPVLAVQATRFVGGGGGGGVAVGVAVHHAVADGQSFWRFMDAWSAAARGRPSPPAPAFDRSAIVHPMAADMARRILRKKAPELPLIPTANLLRRTWERHVVTTLELDSHRIGHIKNRIAELDEATTASPGTERRPRRLPSTFVAVAALVWSSVVRARASRQPDDGARAHLVFPADCRRRLDPPVDAAYFGNCVRCCVAGAAAGDLADAHRGVLHAREAIREAIDGFLEHPMVEAFDAWIDAVAALVRQPGFVAVTASPRFQVYEVDLGWGAPSRVEFASESLPNGMVAMTAGRKEASVQVMATLRPEHMEAFRSQLLYW
ncbi:phenolic glucoside malonyltransferase 1-like [Oryza glaberrima]|uniref:phenolic glucoside malonyltransferase 1-like n=1 Tax=Oryza glaberrima TaxID=4538 RepID=UPI00023DEE4D|nr:phenolic glucoside malonyltransferase 1-like [Oryza glaberrima]